MPGAEGRLGWQVTSRDCQWMVRGGQGKKIGPLDRHGRWLRIQWRSRCWRSTLSCGSVGVRLRAMMVKVRDEGDDLIR